MDELSVETEHGGVRRVTHAPGARGDRVERGLDICWRTRNHTKNLGGCRLPLQGLAYLYMRLGERPILLLQLLEQPNVLDGDDRLVSKGLEQGDLLVGKWTDLGTANGDRPDGHPFLHQGNGHDSSVSQSTGMLTAFRKFFRRRLDVPQVHGPTL